MAFVKPVNTLIMYCMNWKQRELLVAQIKRSDSAHDQCLDIDLVHANLLFDIIATSAELAYCDLDGQHSSSLYQMNHICFDSIKTDACM